MATRAIRILIFVTLVLVVVVFDPGSVKPFDPIKFTALWVLGWLAVGLWAAQIVRGRASFERCGPVIAAVVFAGITAIATLFSISKLTSIFGLYQRYGGLLTTIVLVALFVVVVHVYQGAPERIAELVWAIGAASVVLAAYLVIQLLHLDPITWGESRSVFPRFGTLGNGNFSGGYLGFSAPWIVYAFRRSRSRWIRLALVAWGFVHVGAMVYSAARSGLIAFAVAVGVLVLAHRARIPKVVQALGIVAIVLIVGFASVLFIRAVFRTELGTIDRGFVRASTSRVRVYWWRAGVRIVADHPVIGTGPETFQLVYQRYMSPRSALIPDAPLADEPHNIFIGHAVSAGIVGLVTYLVFVAAVFRRGVRRLREITGDERLLLSVLLAMYSGYLAQAAFSIDVVPLVTTGWIVAGAIVAMTRRPVAESRPTRGDSPVRAVGMALVVILSLVVSSFGVARSIADREARAALEAQRAAEPVDEIRRHFQRAMDLQPHEPIYRGMISNALEQEAASDPDPIEKRHLLEDAVSFYEEMDRLQPGNGLWHMVIGSALGRLAVRGGASFPDAARWLRSAATLNPIDWRVPVAQGDLYRLWSIAERRRSISCNALHHYEAAHRMQRLRSAPLIGIGRSYLRLGRVDEAVAALRRAVKLERLELRRRSRSLQRPLGRRTLDEALAQRGKAVGVVRCPNA